MSNNKYFSMYLSKNNLEHFCDNSCFSILENAQQLGLRPLQPAVHYYYVIYCKFTLLKYICMYVPSVN